MQPAFLIFTTTSAVRPFASCRASTWRRYLQDHGRRLCGNRSPSPYQSIVTELQSRGQVFRWDVNDGACATNPDKIGPDGESEPGGGTDIGIVLKDGVLPQVAVWNGS